MRRSATESLRDLMVVDARDLRRRTVNIFLEHPGCVSEEEEGARAKQAISWKARGKEKISNKSTASILFEESDEGSTDETRQDYVGKVLADSETGQVLLNNKTTCPSRKKNELFVSNTAGDDNYSKLEEKNIKSKNDEGKGLYYGKEGPSE
ncbi:hypothetical protein LguiB_011859 [Lonicera macranthoides]